MTKIRSVVLCDEVRTENTGKKIFIGVYYESIVSTKESYRLRLTYIVEILINSPAPMAFRAMLDGKAIASLSDVQPFGPAEFSDKRIAAVELSDLRVSGQGNAILSLQFREEGKRWREIHSVAIVVERDSDQAQPS